MINVKKKCLMLCSNNQSAKIIYNYLKHEIDFLTIIVEESIPSKNKIKYRIKKLGYISTFGQLLFLVFNKLMKKLSKNREVEIITCNNMDISDFDNKIKLNVLSINSEITKDRIKNSQADLILVAGTRIISKSVLELTNIPFINIHAGITPNYRGVHGGYWSLAKNDSQNCGVTIHLVDKGVDTGEVLAQAIIKPTPRDSFNTYPLLQLVKALPLLKEIVCSDGFKSSKLNRNIPKRNASKQWYHPTIWFYLYTWLFKGVK